MYKAKFKITNGEETRGYFGLGLDVDNETDAKNLFFNDMEEMIEVMYPGFELVKESVEFKKVDRGESDEWKNHWTFCHKYVWAGSG